MGKPKVLFVYDHKYPHLWRDGLWAALKMLEKDFEIKWLNLDTAWNPSLNPIVIEECDFILGWGGFRSKVDSYIEIFKNYYPQVKTGLCLGGYASPAVGRAYNYDILFYETEWSKKWIEENALKSFVRPEEVNLIHAFGINSKIYNPGKHNYYGAIFDEIIYDYLSVGSFSYWKRQNLMLDKKGYRMVIGEIQKENYAESMDIISSLIAGGVAVSDMVEPKTLADIYRASKKVYIPAEEMGGGERAVLEARACGVPVEIMYDNKKLFELLTCPVWDEVYYKNQLKKGILECLK